MSEPIEVTAENIILYMQMALEPMPREKLVKWVLELEKSSHRQGRADLISYPFPDQQPAFCCLGLFDRFVLGRSEAIVRIDAGENGLLPPEIAEGHFAGQFPFFRCNDGGEFVGETENEPIGKTYIWPQLTFKEIAQLIRKARPDVFPA